MCEVRKGALLTVLEDNHATNPDNKVVGLVLKGIAFYLSQWEIPQEGARLVTEILDRLIQDEVLKRYEIEQAYRVAQTIQLKINFGESKAA